MHDPYAFPEVAGKGYAIESGKIAYIGVGAQYTERFCTIHL